VNDEKSLKVAQIGCGYWGKNLLRNFTEIGALSAVVDNDSDLVLAASKEHRVASRSFDEVLADPAIDGVSIATPAVTHAALAERALLAGKHVFVEKPVALNSADAERVQSIAEKRGLTLMVGHLLQYHPIFLALKSLVENGSLGKVHYIYSNRMSLGKLRSEENVLWSFAPHDISMILALVGGEEPESVSAQGIGFVSPNVEDWSTVQMRFASGIAAHVQVSWLHPFKEQRLAVIGENGMAVFEDSKADWNQRLAVYRHQIDRSEPAPALEANTAEFIQVQKGEPLRNECNHFLSCIRSGKTPLTNGREGIRVLKVLEKAERAMKANGSEKNV
jgi:predicted dehydrogenase